MLLRAILAFVISAASSAIAGLAFKTSIGAAIVIGIAATVMFLITLLLSDAGDRR